MIRADIGETIPILATLVNEYTGSLAGGENVYYDIRDMSDAQLSPPLNGLMAESTTTSGIYRAEVQINTSGNYICYISCTGFLTNSEEIRINPENIYTLTKRGYHYNLSVENVVRTNVTPTASQTARNVPLGKTDYVIHRYKDDSDLDWTSPTASGIVYAHYRASTDTHPYMMSDED